MHAVVNSFALREGVDWTALASQVDEFQRQLAAERPDFRGIALVRVSEAQAIFLVFFDNRQALDDISHKIAGPWFAEHVRPLLAGSVNRQVGEIVSAPMQQTAEG